MKNNKEMTMDARLEETGGAEENVLRDEEIKSALRGVRERGQSGVQGEERNALQAAENGQERDSGEEEAESNPRYLDDLSVEDVEGPEWMIRQDETGKRLFSRRNLSMVLGAPKSRKTTLMAGLCSVALGRPLLGLIAAETGYKVVYIDTEQDPGYAKMTHRKVHRLMGWNTKKNHLRFRYYTLSNLEKPEGEEVFLSPQLRRKAEIMEIARNEKPDFVVLDGLVDICEDFNNQKESMALVEELRMLAISLNLHICTCLHTNKDRETERGHLGAMYVQKCESVIKVTKDEQNKIRSSEAPCNEGCRGGDVEECRFTMTEEEGLPVAYDTRLGRGKPEQLSDREIVERMFAASNYKPLRNKDLSGAILDTVNNDPASCIGERAAQKRVEKLKECNVLTQQADGLYVLTRSVKGDGK